MFLKFEHQCGMNFFSRAHSTSDKKVLWFLRRIACMQGESPLCLEKVGVVSVALAKNVRIFPVFMDLGFLFSFRMRTIAAENAPMLCPWCDSHPGHGDLSRGCFPRAPTAPLPRLHEIHRVDWQEDRDDLVETNQSVPGAFKIMGCPLRSGFVIIWIYF